MNTPTAGSRPAQTAAQRRISYAQDAFLVVISAAFAWSHGRAFVEDGRLTSVPLVIEQSILVVLFLSRRRSRHTSDKLWDWTVATVGTWGALALRPWGSAPASVEAMGIGIQIVGVSLAAIAFSNLGRSVGVVAANRGLKTGGLYRFVRHPVYTAHVMTHAGFVMANPHPWNATIAVVVFVGLLLRIGAEERLLSETDDYVVYREQVRWRLCPGLY
ncbi:MAG: methyltransferase family protein [Candidatus Binatia bacterium]